MSYLLCHSVARHLEYSDLPLHKSSIKLADMENNN